MNKILGRNFLISSLLFIIGMFCVSCGNENDSTVLLRGESVSNNTSLFNIDTETMGSEEENSSTSGKKIYVHVTGHVRNPGVYQVGEDARLYEVIELAGGFTKKAEQNYLNLAGKVSDGEQIKVLSKSEYKKLGQKDTESTQNKGTGENGAASEDSLININTATAEELMTLPGIGESKASAIINYREENGMFSSIEQIMQVSGIKEGSFRQIKELIKV